MKSLSRLSRLFRSLLPFLGATFLLLPPSGVAQARAALDEAYKLADRLKREWMRAQVRHDAIVGELDRAVREWKRQLSRRADADLPPMPVVIA